MLPRAELDRLGIALTGFTPDAVTTVLGPVGESALTRGELDGAARALAPGGRAATDPVAVLTRLFLLGRPVPVAAAAGALAPLGIEAAVDHGLLLRDGDEVRATLEVRPYGRPGWWVCSDFGSDVRPGPLRPDHVLGIGGASTTLAGVTIRRPVGRALDVGTGCGVQALHLAEHATEVVATDISSRALRLAATTAALSGQSWDLRAGSLLEPVAGERFDLVVANPPFVVSPGLSGADGGFDYRDSGLAGDEVSRRMVSGLAGMLAPGGVGQLLANWVIPPDGDWAGRVTEWIGGGEGAPVDAAVDAAVDAWVWQREVLGVSEYVTLWLQDAGYRPGTQAFTDRYDRWAGWFESTGVVAVGMGLVTLWRTESEPQVVCEDVRQPYDQPAGAELDAWHRRRQWLARTPELLDARLRTAATVRLDSTSHADRGWVQQDARVRLDSGLRWEVEVDEAVQAVLAAADGSLPVGVLLELVARAFGTDPPHSATGPGRCWPIWWPGASCCRWRWRRIRPADVALSARLGSIRARFSDRSSAQFGPFPARIGPGHSPTGPGTPEAPSALAEMSTENGNRTAAPHRNEVRARNRLDHRNQRVDTDQ